MRTSTRARTRALARTLPLPQPPRRRTAASRETGPITFLILAAINELPLDDRHGAPIEAYVSAALNQPVDLAQIYITLKRLKSAGTPLIDAKLRPSPTSSRDKVTVYQLTTAGRQTLEHAAPFYRALGQVAHKVLKKAS